MSQLGVSLIVGSAVTLAFAAAIVGALFTLARRTFYAILLLALVGAIAASEMALLGFTYLAVFHAVMYVGATVTFLLFTMASIGEDRNEVSIEHSGWAMLTALLASIVVGLPLVAFISNTPVKPLPENAWSDAARVFFVKNPLVVIIVIITIVSILVEVIAVARRG